MATRIPNLGLVALVIIALIVCGAALFLNTPSTDLAETAAPTLSQADLSDANNDSNLAKRRAYERFRTTDIAAP